MRHSLRRSGPVLSAICVPLLAVRASLAEQTTRGDVEQPPVAEGQTAAPAPTVVAAGPRLGLRLGYAFFGRSRSYALEHLFKPALRLDAFWSLAPHWEVGAAASGVLTTDGNYGVWSLTARLGYKLLDGESFSLRALLGVGAGYNAPILHSDLEAGFPVIPYAVLGLEPTFHLAGGWDLGIGLELEQLTVVQLGATLATTLP